MKPISPFPDGVAKRPDDLPGHAEENAGVRFYRTAAWAFVWAPLLPVALFYMAEFAGPLGKLLSPLCVVSALASPVLLIAAIVIVLTSKRRSRWLFAPLNAGALLFELFVFGWMQSFSGIYK